MKLPQRLEANNLGNILYPLSAKLSPSSSDSPYISLPEMRNDTPFRISTEMSGQCFMYLPAILSSFPILWILLRYKKKYKKRDGLYTARYVHFCKVYIIQTQTKRKQVCATADEGDNRYIFYVIPLVLKGDEVTENGGSCTMRSFIFYTPPKILLGRSSQVDWGGRKMWHAREMRGKCTGFRWESEKKETTWKTNA
jgi:hypothetical protein